MDTLTACQWKHTREFCETLPRPIGRGDYHRTFEKARRHGTSIADRLPSLPVLRSPRETLAGIVWLNVAAHISVRLTVAARVTHDVLAWEQSFAARWTPGWLRDAARKETIRESSNRAIRSCLTPWTLTKSSLMPSYLHTWITNAFIHVDFLHLLSNMLGLWKLGIVLGGLPNVSAIDILCITMGASVSGSAASLIVSQNMRSDFIGCGASAVVYAISVAASLGAPTETIKLEMQPLEIHAKPWAVTVFSLATDILGFLASQGGLAANLHRRFDSSATQSIPWDQNPRTRIFVGHAAHLAGAAIGAAYYWLILRPKMARVQNRRLTEGLANGMNQRDQRDTEQDHSILPED